MIASTSAMGPPPIIRPPSSAFSSKSVSSPTGPHKRRKVSIDEKPQIWNYPSTPTNDSINPPELVAQEVRDALSSITKSGTPAYDKLYNMFTTRPNEPDAPSQQEQKAVLHALAGEAALFTKPNAPLLRAMLKSTWLGCNPSYWNSFRLFLNSLVTSQGSMVSIIMRHLFLRLNRLPRWLGTVPDEPPMSSTELVERVMIHLKDIMSLVPSANRLALSLIPDSFPDLQSRVTDTMTFVNNILSFISIVPQLRDDILNIIMDRLVKIDVQIQTDLQDLIEDDEDFATFLAAGRAPKSLSEDAQDNDTGFENEDDDDDSGDEDETEDERKERLVKANIEKVDALMAVLFQYYDTSSKKLSPSQRSQRFTFILNQWTNIILPSYHSKHAQFLLFYAGQSSPENIDHLCTHLFGILKDFNRPSMQRQVAAAYLSSFVARGANVSTEKVRSIFRLLSNELQAYKLEKEAACIGPDLIRYPMLYALFQALIYIFCFRWRSLVTDPSIFDRATEDELRDLYENRVFEWIDEVKAAINPLVFSRFNPLKVCAQEIVKVFANVSHHLGLVYVHSKIEANKRVQLTATASVMGGRSGAASRYDDIQLQVDDYFPFDPYLLPNSKVWVDKLYIPWASPPGMDADEDDEEDEEEEDED